MSYKRWYDFHIVCFILFSLYLFSSRQKYRIIFQINRNLPFHRNLLFTNSITGRINILNMRFIDPNIEQNNNRMLTNRINIILVSNVFFSFFKNFYVWSRSMIISIISKQDHSFLLSFLFYFSFNYTHTYNRDELNDDPESDHQV